MAEKVNVCRVGCGSTAEGGLHFLIGPIGLAITLCVKTRTETELGSVQNFFQTREVETVA